LFDGIAAHGDEQDHYLLLADGFVLVYEITSKASFDLVTSIRQKITRNKEVKWRFPVFVERFPC
jgi:hypothetical protein